MGRLKLLIVLTLISISTFAGKTESITNQNEFETKIPPTCTKTETVSRSGTYECNGTTITVTAISTKTATAATCEKATEDATKVASLQAYNSVLLAIAAGIQVCEPA